MKPLTIPILYHTDESKELTRLNEDANIDVEIDLSDLETRDVIFYSITAISRGYGYGNNEITLIYACGDSFECPLKFKEVEKLIAQNL